MRIHPSTKFLLAAASLFPLPAFASTTNPTVGTWQITKYDVMTAEGLLETQQISATGNVTKGRTDGAGRTRQAVDAEGNVSIATYDNNGNLLSSRDANGVGQDCTYDEQNRKVSCTDTIGITTIIKYSVGGLALNQRDGKAVWAAADATYDARGRMTSKTTRLDGGDKTLFTYDVNGNRLTVTDGEGKVTRYEYDQRNLKIAWAFPGHDATKSPGQTGYDKVTYEYDAAARLAAFNRQDGTRDENTYSFNGTLVSKQFKDALGAVTSTDSFLYDINNRLVQAIKGRYSNTVALAYDALGRKASESLTVGGQTYTTQYGYDADNRNTGIIYPDGKTVARTYTQRNQLQSVSLNSQAILTSATYDAGGRETQRTLGNGTQQSRTYRNDGLPSGMATTGDTGSSVTYTYDQNKNLTAEQFQGALVPFATTLAQDAKDRLTQFTRTNGDTANWTLTKEGDWSNLAGSQGGLPVSQTRSHNDNHQITAIAGTTVAVPTYDAQGDLTTDEQGRVYTWNQEKQLAGIVGGTTNVGYAYDAMGRRVSKTEGGNTTVYVSSGSQEIQEYVGTTAAKTYVHGTYVDEMLAQQDGAGSNLYYISDRRYSTTALADQSGVIVERYAYDPYGKVTVLDVSGVVKTSPAMTEILWTGRRLDGTGNYYFRSRYFSTALGRFISRDVDYLDGWNLYEGYFAEKGGMDWNGKVSWNIDINNCSITMNYKVQTLFIDNGADVWTQARKVSFQQKLKSQIELIWNSSGLLAKPGVSSYTPYTMIPTPTGGVPSYGAPKCCPCKNGVSFKVNIELVPIGDWSISEDWEVDVTANSSNIYMQSSTNTSYGYLDEADVNIRPDFFQIPVVHEFGHAIGLMHPGYGISGVTDEYQTPPGGVDRYGRPVSNNDLMGEGMGMRGFYYDKWVGRLNEAYPCQWGVK